MTAAPFDREVDGYPKHMTKDRLPLLMFLGVALIVVLVAGMATGSWWVFGIALAAHLTVSAIVLTSSARTAQAGSLESDESERLHRIAREAVPPGRPDTLENELEALKREPARRN